MAREPQVPVAYYRYHSGGWERVEAHLVREMPVTLLVNGETWLTWMCTPTNLEDLAVGFLYNEGLISGLDEIAALSACESGEFVDVWLNHALTRPNTWKRTSGCSGGMTAALGNLVPIPIQEEKRLQPEMILDQAQLLLQAQALYRLTGGVHSSILSDGQHILAQAEDIGRHNTLDKIAGRCLAEGLQGRARFLVTTGRISSEMLQKAARMQVPVVISRTSPNSLSVQMACSLGITLIGYSRRDQFQVYSHPERIEGVPQAAAVSWVECLEGVP